MNFKGEWLAPIAALGLGLAYLFGKKESVKAVDLPKKDGGDSEGLTTGVGSDVKERYARIELDLTAARSDEEIHIEGDYIHVAFYDGEPDDTYFKLNQRNSREINPSEVTEIKSRFNKIYMTNVAQNLRKIVLYVGTKAVITSYNDRRSGKAKGSNIASVGSTGYTFSDYHFLQGCMITVITMGSNTWIDIIIESPGFGTGKVRCTAAGQGIAWLPIDNANSIKVSGDNAADDGYVSYIGV